MVNYHKLTWPHGFSEFFAPAFLTVLTSKDTRCQFTCGASQGLLPVSSRSPSDYHSDILPCTEFYLHELWEKILKGVPSNFTRQEAPEARYLCLSNLFLGPTKREKACQRTEEFQQRSSSRTAWNKLSSPWTMNRTRQIRKEQERL